MDGCRCSRDSTGRSPLVVESSILVAPDPLRGGWVSFLALCMVDMLPLALSAARYGRGADRHAFISSNEPPSSRGISKGASSLPQSSLPAGRESGVDGR